MNFSLKTIKAHFTRKRVRLYLFVFLILPLLLLFWSNYRVESISDPYVTSDLNRLPKVKVAIIPGTIKLLASGNENQYFTHRIDAAVRLYRSGKVSHFLISGDNSRKDYNEPEDMRLSLIEQGIPDSVITLDYAGFDTYDSMIRAREVFGQKRFIVVSQEFQNERAVYIARSFGIEAYGYNAKDVHRYGGFRTRIREFFARGKAYVEVLVGVKPTFLGERIHID